MEKVIIFFRMITDFFKIRAPKSEKCWRRTGRLLDDPNSNVVVRRRPKSIHKTTYKIQIKDCKNKSEFATSIRTIKHGLRMLYGISQDHLVCSSEWVKITKIIQDGLESIHGNRKSHCGTMNSYADWCNMTMFISRSYRWKSWHKTQLVLATMIEEIPTLKKSLNFLQNSIFQHLVGDLLEDGEEEIWAACLSEKPVKLNI
jgi:hypothetical protein